MGPAARAALALLAALVPVSSGASTLQDRGFRRERPRRALEHLEGRKAPPLEVEGWMNAPAAGLAWSDLAGKVVLVDFWGTWCAPCVRSLPHLLELHERYPDDLVIVGVHSTRGAERMQDFVERRELPWPIAADRDGKTEARFDVDGFPDYFLIDREGVLRIADVRSDQLDRAIAFLVRDGQPAVPEDELRAWVAQRPEAVLADEATGLRIELGFEIRNPTEDEGESASARLVAIERWFEGGRARRSVVTEATLAEPLAPTRIVTTLRPAAGGAIVVDVERVRNRFVGTRTEGGAETPVELELGGPTLSVSSFWRAGLVAPREPGARLSVQLADVVGGELVPGAFECEGPETLTLGAKEVPTVRYGLRRFGKPPTTYWIDAGGHVVAFEAPDARLVLR